MDLGGNRSKVSRRKDSLHSGYKNIGPFPLLISKGIDHYLVRVVFLVPGDLSQWRLGPLKMEPGTGSTPSTSARTPTRGFVPVWSQTGRCAWSRVCLTSASCPLRFPSFLLCQDQASGKNRRDLRLGCLCGKLKARAKLFCTSFSSWFSFFSGSSCSRFVTIELRRDVGRVTSLKKPAVGRRIGVGTRRRPGPPAKRVPFYLFFFWGGGDSVPLLK